MFPHIMLDGIRFIFQPGNLILDLADLLIILVDQSLHERPEHFHTLMDFLGVFHQGAER
jgi:hypothetical protein